MNDNIVIERPVAALGSAKLLFGGGRLFSGRGWPSCRRSRLPLREHPGEPSITNRTVHIPYALELDEDGIWCAHAQLRPGVGAHGEGDSPEAALDDLREALGGLIAEFGAPDELTLTLDVA